MPQILGNEIPPSNYDSVVRQPQLNIYNPMDTLGLMKPYNIQLHPGLICQSSHSALYVASGRSQTLRNLNVRLWMSQTLKKKTECQALDVLDFEKPECQV